MDRSPGEESTGGSCAESSPEEEPTGVVARKTLPGLGDYVL